MNIDQPLIDKIITCVKQGQLNVAFKLLGEQFNSTRDAEVWLKLGTLCDSSGMKNESVKCYQHAIQLDPKYAQAFSYLGKAYVELGETQKALEVTHKAVKLNKNDPLNQFYRGYVLHAIDKYGAALEHFLVCLKLSPDNAMVHALAGSCCQSLGNAKKLVYHYEMSLKINPKLVDSMIRLGGYYQSTGDFVRAEDYFNQALLITPDSPAALSIKANFLVKTGNKDEAYAIVRDLIDSRRETPYTLNVYAELCVDYDEVENFIKLSEECLTRKDANNTIKRDLGYALGHIYDRAGEYDMAFEKYNMANELFYGAFDLEALVDYSDKIIDIYNKDFFMHAPKNTETIKKPIFIIGMPRSGTSLTEQVLSQHSRVYGAGELTFIRDIVKHHCMLNNKVHLKAINSFSDTDVKNIARDYIEKIDALSGGAEKVTDKMPSNYLYVGLIAQLFPGAKILHCRRDPRDTCLSIFFQNFSVMQPFSSNLENIANVYMDYDRLMRHWTENLNVQMYEVHYEDLVGDFDRKVGGILSYCELEWEDQCLEFYKSKRNVSTASFNQVNKPIYNKSVARWKNYKKYITEIENILEPVL